MRRVFLFLIVVALLRAAFLETMVTIAQDRPPVQLLLEKVSPEGRIAQIRLDERGVCWEVDADRAGKVWHWGNGTDCLYLEWINVNGVETVVTAHSDGSYYINPVEGLFGHFISAVPEYFFEEFLYERCPDAEFVDVGRFIGPPQSIPDGALCAYEHEIAGLRHEFSPAEAWAMTFQAFDPDAYGEEAAKIAERQVMLETVDLETRYIDDLEEEVTLGGFIPFAFYSTRQLGPVLLGVDYMSAERQLYVLTFTGEYLLVKDIVNVYPLA